MTFLTPDNLRAAMGGRWLQRAAPGTIFRGVGIDGREDLHQRMFIAIRGEQHDGHDFVSQAVGAGAALLVVERPPPPGTAPAEVGMLLVSDTRLALRRLAQAYRSSWGLTKVVAVTGSAGKTTTKALIHAVLSSALSGSAAPRSYNNQIGVPLTLLAVRPGDAYVVVEIGSNAPGEVGALAQIAAPDIAVITMLGRAHMEGLGSEEGVAREKLALLGALRPGGVAILNADCPRLRPATRGERTCILFGSAEDAHLRLTRRGRQRGRWWFEVNQRTRFGLGLPGRHNACNALAAVAVGRRFGLSDEAIGAALSGVEPLPMRFSMQPIARCRIYNDAYNANPESMLAALETFVELEARAARRLLVLGDMLELGSAAEAAHHELADSVLRVGARSPFHHVVLFGKLAAGVTARRLSESLGKERVTARPRLTAAAAKAVAALLRPGDAVLIKASRGLGLERLVAALEKGAGAQPRRKPRAAAPAPERDAKSRRPAATRR